MIIKRNIFWMIDNKKRMKENGKGCEYKNKQLFYEDKLMEKEKGKGNVIWNLRILMGDYLIRNDFCKYRYGFHKKAPFIINK